MTTFPKQVSLLLLSYLIFGWIVVQQNDVNITLTPPADYNRLRSGWNKKESLVLPFVDPHALAELRAGRDLRQKQMELTWNMEMCN